MLQLVQLLTPTLQVLAGICDLLFGRRRLPFQGAGQVPTRLQEPVGNQHRVRQRGDQVSVRRRSPRSCSTRLCPIDLGDRLVIQLPQNLEAPIGPGRVCPIRSQQRLHDPWEQIRVNARVAVELKLKRAIVQTVQSVGSDRRFSLWRVWRQRFVGRIARATDLHSSTLEPVAVEKPAEGSRSERAG